MTDILDRLIWEETNSLSPDIAELCGDARRVIERLREYAAALQADRQMAAAEQERLLEAGTALWAFIVVNANEAILTNPQFSKVEKGWQQVSWEAHRG